MIKKQLLSKQFEFKRFWSDKIAINVCRRKSLSIHFVKKK